MREGLRAILYTHNGGERDQDALDQLERAAGRASLRATFARTACPSSRRRAKGTDAGLARLLAIVARSAADGTWDRLKACAGPDCRWAFYDKSKNRSGRWCSMATCGNLHKTRAFRERREGLRQVRRAARAISEKAALSERAQDFVVDARSALGFI